MDLEGPRAGSARLPIVRLALDLAMAPLSEGWMQRVQGAGFVDAPGESSAAAAAAGSAAGAFEFLTLPIERWIRDLSGGTAVAYVETEYFGGEGFERSAVWRDGTIVLGPLDGAGSINRALRFLGVVAEPGREEFDLVGLGRHRSIDEWLSVAFRPDEPDAERGGERRINQNV
jgi:hypothetical protein